RAQAAGLVVLGRDANRRSRWEGLPPHGARRGAGWLALSGRLGPEGLQPSRQGGGVARAREGGSATGSAGRSEARAAERPQAPPRRGREAIGRVGGGAWIPSRAARG